MIIVSSLPAVEPEPVPDPMEVRLAALTDALVDLAARVEDLEAARELARPGGLSVGKVDLPDEYE